MPDNDLALLVQNERERTEQQIAELQRTFDDIIESSESVAADDEHDPDGSTIAFERAQVSALLGQATARLGMLDAADQRLRDQTFGVCIRCGNPMSLDRLRAVPLAMACVVCSDVPRSG